MNVPLKLEAPAVAMALLWQCHGVSKKKCSDMYVLEVLY